MTSKAFTEKQFHCTEVALSYVEGPPHGTPIVLLHGAGSRWQPFEPILPALAEKHHVYALDLRGHGRSGHTPGAYHLDDFTRDVHQFITQQIQGPVVVYGHSLGALVGMNLTAQHPHNIRALILGDPPLFHHDTRIQDTFWQEAFTELLSFMTDCPSSAEREARLIQNYPNMPPERREERLRSLEGLDPGVIHAILSNEQLRGIKFADLAAQVACPVLLLRGNPELGSALREQDVDFAVTHFPNIRVLEMKMIGHGVIPATLLPQMIEFIDAVMSNQEHLDVV